jgi:hypothetical protein
VLGVVFISRTESSKLCNYLLAVDGAILNSRRNAARDDGNKWADSFSPSESVVVAGIYNVASGMDASLSQHFIGAGNDRVPLLASRQDIVVAGLIKRRDIYKVKFIQLILRRRSAQQVHEQFVKLVEIKVVLYFHWLHIALRLIVFGPA